MPRSPELRWGVAYHGGDGVFGAGGLRGVEVASVEIKDGYTVEARLPWKDLGLRGTTARRIGFALALNDNDGDRTLDGRCT